MDMQGNVALSAGQRTCVWALPGIRAAGARYLDGLTLTVARWRAGELPPDVTEDEFVDCLCFRISLVLNAATGGAPDMTFSARCHAGKRHGRSMPARLGWALAARCIDLSCAVLRGEAEHCATAWQNHMAR